MDVDQFIHSYLQTSVEAAAELGKKYSREIASIGFSVAQCLLRGNKILTCGDVRSAANAKHIATECVGRFRCERRNPPSIALMNPGATATASGNDHGYENAFSRQVERQGRRGDVLFCLTTSGNSPDVVNAAATACHMGIQTIGLTGQSGGKLADAAGIAIRVSSDVPAHIQESHLAIAHMAFEIAEEMLRSGSGCSPQTFRASEKIRSLPELAEMREGWRRQGQTVVWTNGCFDLLHNGHVRNLADAKAEGSILIVGLNSDRSVQAIKGPGRPIQNEQARAEMLAALACVDYVTVFDDPTPVQALELIQPDIHCKGADYANNRKPIPERETVEKHGGRIHFLELLPGFSTTSLIERIRSEQTAKLKI